MYISYSQLIQYIGFHPFFSNLWNLIELFQYWGREIELPKTRNYLPEWLFIFFFNGLNLKEKWNILRKFVPKVPFLKWNYVTQFTLWQSLWLILDLILILCGLKNLTFPWCIFEWLYSQAISFFTLSEFYSLWQPKLYMIFHGSCYFPF